MAGFQSFGGSPSDVKGMNEQLRSLISLSKVYSLDNDRDINIYLTKAHHLRSNYTKSYHRDWWVTSEQTTWDVLKELALFEKDYIVTTRTFNDCNYSLMRETVFIGPRNSYYMSNDLDAFKYNIVKDMLYPQDESITLQNISWFWEDGQDRRSGLFSKIDNGFLGPIHRWFSRMFSTEYHNYLKPSGNFTKDSEKEILSEIIMKNTIQHAETNNSYLEWLVSSPTANDEYSLELLKNSAKAVSKSIVNNAMPYLKPIRKTHFISATTNLIANGITVNSNFFNKVILQFPKMQPNPDIKRVASSAFVFTRLKNIIFGSGSGLSSVDFTMDENIKPENVKEYITYQKNIDTDSAEVGVGGAPRFAVKKEIDSFVNLDNSYSQEKAMEQLSQIAGMINATTGPFAGRGNWGNNPFIYSTKSDNAGESNINADKRYIENMPPKIANKIIDTANGAISAKEYLTRLQEVSGGGLTEEQCQALLHASYIRMPQYYNVGRNILATQANKMYDGFVTIIGDMTVNPYDRCVLYDITNNMYGLFEVRAVTHKYSSSNGFTTIIVPDLITYMNDKMDVFDASYLLDRISKRANLFTSINFLTSGVGSVFGGIIAAIGVAGGTASGVAAALGISSAWVGAIIIAGSAIIGGLFALMQMRHMANQYAEKEANDVLGRHAIGFMPIMKGTVPYVAGIGGYKRTSWKTIKIQEAVAIPSFMDNIGAALTGEFVPTGE